MFRRYSLMAAAILLPFQLAGQVSVRPVLEQQLVRPFADLLDIPSREYSRAEIKSLRSDLQRERDVQAEMRRKEREGFEKDLDLTHKQLKQLNERSSRDVPAIAAQRANLHVNVAALEHVIRDKRQQEQDVLREFQVKLAKLNLIERWPDRRAVLAGKIDLGRAHERKHGDIEDIGYRKLTGKQEDDDAATGQRLIRQMAASGLMPAQIQDPTVQEYAARLGNRIAHASDLKTPLRIAVLDSPEINAIGLPGGFLFMTSGLILAAETECEVAGVLSREVAGIAARHRLRASKRSILPKFIAPASQVATGVLTGGVSNAGEYYGMNLGFQGLGAVVDRVFAPREEKYQKEADQLGIQYAWNAGFNPKGFVEFVDAFVKDKRRSRSVAYVRMNDLGDRLTDAFSEIQYLPAKPYYTDDSDEFQRMKQRLKAVAPAS